MAGIDTIYNNPINHPSGSGGEAIPRKIASIELTEPVSVIDVSLPDGAKEVYIHFYNRYDSNISSNHCTLYINNKNIMLGQNMSLDISAGQHIAVKFELLEDGIGYTQVSVGSQSANLHAHFGFSPCAWKGNYSGNFGETLNAISLRQIELQKQFGIGSNLDVWVK